MDSQEGRAGEGVRKAGWPGEAGCDAAATEVSADPTGGSAYGMAF